MAMTKINLLLAEDNDTDALLLIRQLRKEGFEVAHVQVKTRKEMEEALERGGWDIVISDFSMPGFGGGDALELFKSRNLDIPFILVSGTVGEDIAVSIMKAGANDYLMKTHLNRLGPAVKRELEETRMKREKRRVESMLKQNEKRFERLIQDLVDVVWLADVDGEHLYIVNSAFDKLLGEHFDRASFKPNRWEEMVIEEDIPPFRRFIDELKIKGICALEYRIRRKDGTERWLFDQRYIVPGDENGEAMTGGILSDISDKKIAEQELITAKTSAEESSRLKSALLQNMSHEFRTPMNGILGFSEILANELDEPGSKMMSQHILTSGKRLQQTLDSIMLFAQLESGIPLKMVPVDVRTMVNSITECLGEPIHRKGLFLKVDISEPFTLSSDENLLKRTLFNLIENAVKFTTQGGITISGKALFSGEVEIRVSDTGIGIAPEKQSIIFEEFRQAEEGYNRPYEGSGLGLAIVRKTINALGGKISLISETGRGSEFIITLRSGESSLPLKTIHETIAIQPDQPADASPDLPLVLLVEDNEANIDLVTLFLKNQYRIDVARDGETSLEMVKEKHYQAILMDINLGPGIDGIDAITAIRKLENYRSTPIIAVTGYTFRDEKEYIIAKGASHYLEKPFNKNVLLNLLRESII